MIFPLPVDNDADMTKALAPLFVVCITALCAAFLFLFRFPPSGFRSMQQEAWQEGSR